MKISALEYQKGEGKIDLSHLKRKNYKDSREPSPRVAQNNTTVANATINNKISAPKNLAPVILGN